MHESSNNAVFVNVIDVDPSRYRELIGILTECIDSVVRRRAGFISEMILASGDRSRVINVEVWKSAEAVKALESDPVIAGYAKRVAALATAASPGVFAVVAEYRP